jgi:hypothetical protein
LLRTPPVASKESTNRSIPARPTPILGNPVAKLKADETLALVDDDGETLWAPPTSGPPLDLSFLPPGCQIIIAARPSQMNPRDFKALGPYRTNVERVLTLHVVSVPHVMWVGHVLIGLQVTSDGDWLMTRVRRYPKPFDADTVRLYASETFDVHRTYKGESYGLAEEQAFYLTNKGSKGVLVAASEESIKEIIELGGNPPPLRRDMERLLAGTDSDRDVTILFAPNFLFGEGQGMFTGEWALLRDPLFWFLGDGLSAAAVSADWGENFFLELTAIPTVDKSAEQVAGELAERVAQLPDRINEFVSRLDPHPHGRQIIARFPDMVRQLAAYTRSGVEDGRAVLRCYLPAVAGHNLIMGTELTLAEAASGARREGNAAVTSAPSAEEASVSSRLGRVTSLKIARDSLEAALEQLSQDIGVEIILLGPDLQADGITRNQSLAIDIQNRPADEILVEILRLANPDKSAAGPQDVRQKLVYVVRAKTTNGPEAVYITTRSAAAQRGEELPPTFAQPTP